ncbi:hypothetical protein DFQ12_0191 [Sphingobacterium detergens]|uniref:Uncharacterized protein n=1 Tax=Sphingobacterium detergens TaxID=1145106 RepID=A0A420BF83_SPHD1|nr:hypothetical protein DFQ12_0191 [Sphingobacterium detergens]
MDFPNGVKKGDEVNSKGRSVRCSMNEIIHPSLKKYSLKK